MPKTPEPSPEEHWGPSDPEHQPPLEEVMSIQRLVQEARARLGPAADMGQVLADLQGRGLELDQAAVSRVWQDQA